MIITICGSMRFKQEMMKITQDMTLNGHCVLTPVFSNDEQRDYTPEQRQKLKSAHLKKIDLSDAILVVNVNNYIGDSTNAEIEYAKQKNKQILYYTDLI